MKRHLTTLSLQNLWEMNTDEHRLVNRNEPAKIPTEGPWIESKVLNSNITVSFIGTGNILIYTLNLGTSIPSLGDHAIGTNWYYKHIYVMFSVSKVHSHQHSTWISVLFSTVKST
jgi:hypothetical protein